jgi:hypothetical protein
MLNFVTVNWQNYQGRGAEYVNILFDSVRRNLEDGAEGRFVVFTDQVAPAGYAPGIEVAFLPPGLTGWWNKLALFAPGTFADGDRIVYLDLDTLITGPLDALAAYDGPFAILKDFYRPTGMQSSVMAWAAGEQAELWDSFLRAGCPQDNPGGDQWWMELHACKGRVRFLQTLFPDFFVSYKVSGGVLPQKASVVVFHGTPRPHEVTTGWVPRVWREGGLSNVELKAVCNTATDALLDNVRRAAARDLDWFAPADEHQGHVAIIGGGPSLVDKISEIKHRQSIGQTVWVLNNAHKALEGTGIRYDAQVLLDARPDTAGFVTDASGYLVASQCDPTVFAALRHQRVTLFHVNSPGMEFLSAEKVRPAYLVGGGTTVGMNALALAFLKGYRKIHLYGFDSCYRDGAHHAYPQALNDGERASEALYGDRTYFCAPWMIGQAQEFIELVPGYMADGAVITVHGTGLLPDIGLDMLGVLSPAQQRAAEVLARVPAGARGVEVGVFVGQMSAALLRGDPNMHLIMVDSWEGGGGAYAGDSGDWHATLSEASQDEFKRQAEARVAFAGERADICPLRSVDASGHFPDAAVDFVFIDADHSYEGCKRDLEVWFPKIRPGGWICGHDYENTAFPKFGVTRAVNEFVAARGLELELGGNFTWFARLLEPAAPELTEC